ncbi:phage holin family protein [Escherichia marmotae]|uniref:phage holin family protein n=1 Tax=Escherichia marmotae TaxID=1499973 RepID=UPI0015F16596|nr:phage holin family protein [Escherichia marmotae]MBA7739963.1 phage holin family protein [Escherichia marmotae]MBA7954096.1 phage holin family protein [Escherichia marmotae]MED9363128.1 phage holin family protein [Escherichia marmotae]MED9495187.1 phage holin family protein [Escherichia marmotae]MED9520740.1 phage holin family protein [Escherichia marmotae]
MQEHEKSLYSLLVIGGLIAVGNVLNSNDPITPRLFAGRVILGSLVSVVAGTALIQIPDASPLAIQGLGAALGIAGYQAVEVWLRRRAMGKQDGSKNNDSE